MTRTPSTFVSSRTSTGFFKAVCSACGRYFPIFSFELRLDGVTYREHRYCEDHQSLADSEIPTIRECSGCGRSRDARIHDGCECGCSDLKRPARYIMPREKFDVAEIIVSGELPKVTFDNEGKFKTWRDLPPML